MGQIEMQNLITNYLLSGFLIWTEREVNGATNRVTKRVEHIDETQLSLSE